MTQKTIKNFVNGTSSKPSKKNYSNTKTNVYHFDDIWCLDKLDLKNYGPKILEVINMFQLQSTISENLHGQMLSKIKGLKL